MFTPRKVFGEKEMLRFWERRLLQRKEHMSVFRNIIHFICVHNPDSPVARQCLCAARLLYWTHIMKDSTFRKITFPSLNWLIKMLLRVGFCINIETGWYQLHFPLSQNMILLLHQWRIIAFFLRMELLPASWKWKMLYYMLVPFTRLIKPEYDCLVST